MRIAFLNPWSEAAENQEFSKVRIAAGRVGHELIQCTNSADVEKCAPDFVLVASPTQAKLNDVPHYGIIHAPLDRYLTNRTYFHNLLSYDGYLAIADSLDKFLRNLTFGIGRPRPVGFYFNTSQRHSIAADLRGLIERRALQITYFGTNWDNRRVIFFRKLSDSEGVQICGPERGWQHINKKAYGGPLPWDGASVQAKYAETGIGLCMLSDDHLRDDVISNRIFEITSVGAIALCCDIPWIRKHFGDSVYYFDQNLSDAALAAAVLELRESIYADPESAISKASRAREIFEANFSSEMLFENTVRYHELLSSSRSSAIQTAEETYSPLISVIVRCGSRELEYVERAVASIARQSYGRFEVIFVRHQDLDLTPVTAALPSRIASFRIVDCKGGNRSASLWAGLNAVTGEYFAVLDDDDWWFSDHFELLFQPFPKGRLEKFMAYSGSIAVRPEPVPITGGGSDNRELHRFGIESLESWNAAGSAFTANSFVASSDLLHPRVLISPGMETAEDSYLILLLMAQVEPRFSYAATSVFDRSLPGQSDFASHPQRIEDELTLQIRLIGRDRPRFLPLDAWKSLSEYWSRQFQDASVAAADSDALLNDWEQVASGYDSENSNVWGESLLSEGEAGTAAIHTLFDPWAYAARLSLQPASRDAAQYTLVVEMLVREGRIGIGLLNLEESDFLFRRPLGAKPEPQILLIPIRDVTKIGRLVIQNWDTPGESEAELVSLRLLAPPF